MRLIRGQLIDFGSLGLVGGTIGEIEASRGSLGHNFSSMGLLGLLTAQLGVIKASRQSMSHNFGSLGSLRDSGGRWGKILGGGSKGHNCGSLRLFGGHWSKIMGHEDTMLII